MKNKKLTIWVSLFVFFIMLIFSTGALANAKQKTPSDLLEFLKQTYGYSFVDERAKAAVSYDLNSDGKNEYILWGASCGTGGCNYGIFKKNKNSYINILTYNENNNLTSKIYLQFEAKVLKTKHNGWFDIQISVKNSKDVNYNGTTILIYKNGYYNSK